eukprot:3302819-Alexandrium_andersonii.AAC.1
MSASLVGSEMCIRDSLPDRPQLRRPGAGPPAPARSARSHCREGPRNASAGSASSRGPELLRQEQQAPKVRQCSQPMGN